MQKYIIQYFTISYFYPERSRWELFSINYLQTRHPVITQRSADLNYEISGTYIPGAYQLALSAKHAFGDFFIKVFGFAPTQ
jgi:hypothetical protein